MGSKMDIFSKVSDDKMLKIYHDMLESNMIGSKSTMIRAYAKELASVYPFETNAQAIDLAEKLFFEETAKRFYGSMVSDREGKTYLDSGKYRSCNGKGKKKNAAAAALVVDA